MAELYTVKEAGANIFRLLNHLENNDVAFITPFRHGLTKIENINRNKELSLDLHNMGLGYIRVKGSYLEEPENDEVEAKTVIEDSYVVIHKPTSKESQDEFFDEMLGLCGKYDQDAVLISLLNREDIPKASYNSKGEIVYGPFNKLTFNGVEEFFTQLHGYKFKMESCTESEEGIKPDSFSNAMAYYGTKAKVKLYK